jgi:hypothetical protein
MSSDWKTAQVLTCDGFVAKGRRAALSNQIVAVREPLGQAEWFGLVRETEAGILIQSVIHGKAKNVVVPRANVLKLEYMQ